MVTIRSSGLEFFPWLITPPPSYEDGFLPAESLIKGIRERYLINMEAFERASFLLGPDSSGKGNFYPSLKTDIKGIQGHGHESVVTDRRNDLY